MTRAEPVEYMTCPCCHGRGSTWPETRGYLCVIGGRSVPLGPRAGTARAELGEATCNGRMGLLPPLGGDYGASENPANTVSRIFCDQDFRAGTEDKTPGHGACGPEGSEVHLVE